MLLLSANDLSFLFGENPVQDTFPRPEIERIFQQTNSVSTEQEPQNNTMATPKAAGCSINIPAFMPARSVAYYRPIFLLQTTILEEWAINTSVCRLIVVHHRRWTATQPWRANMINSHLEPPSIQLLPLNINGELQIKNPITLHVQSPRTLQQRLGFIGAWIQREETQQLFDKETRQHLYCSDVVFNKSHGMMCISIEIWLYHKRSVGLVSYVCTRQHLASSQQFNPHNNMNKDDIDSTFEGCSLCFIHIHVQICVFLRSLICDVLSIVAQISTSQVKTYS